MPIFDGKTSILSGVCLGGGRNAEIPASNVTQGTLEAEGYVKVQITDQHAAMIHSSFSPFIEDRREAAVVYLISALVGSDEEGT